MRSKIILILFFCCVLFNLKGEGTKQLRPNNADFGYINLMDQQNNLGIERTFALYNATDETRLNIRIQNPNQEKIYLGFKANNTNTLYYRIKDPNGNILVAETLVPQTDGDNGKILNYNEAVFGPNVISAGGYKAIVVNPVAGLVGDYSIEFRDPNHNPPSNYARRYFELFDITVVNTSTNKAIDGRLWSKAWDITTTSASRGFNGATYIYTNDGITTQVGFKDFKAWSFIIQSNSTGPGNSGDVAEDRKSINGGVLLPDYKIFLTTPDASAFPTSVVPSISGTPNIDLCDPSGLYCIDINVSNAGIVEYVIDIAGGKGYDHVRDVKLVETTVSGNNCLPWDGLDGQGNPLTILDTFDIILSYQAGVTNLFIHDAENNPEGFNVQHVAPLTGLGQPLLYFDDSNSSVGGSTNLNGCSSNCHQWSSNFGDNKTINTWWVTYFENDTIKDLNLNKPQYFAKAEINVDSPINCKGENLVLTPKNVVNGGSSPVYSWWVNDDFINNNSTFSPLQLNDQDSISLVLSSSDPCTANDTVSLIIEVPTLSISSKDTSICKGDSVLLTTSTVSNASGLTYAWTPTSTLSESTKTSTLAFPTATQNYKIVVSNDKGCKDSTEILLTVHDLPSGTISQTDPYLCPGEQSDFEITTTSGVATQWYYSLDGSSFQTKTTNLTFTSNTAGYYFAVLENAQKCQSITDTLLLEVAEGFSISSKDTSICNGDSILLSTSTLSNASGLTYAWTPTTRLSESTKASTLAFPTATENYKIVVSNDKGCKDSTEILLTVHDLPSGTISQTDPYLCPGEQSDFEIITTSGVAAQWYYSIDGSSFQTKTTNLTFTSNTAGYYFAVLENTQKCQFITDTLLLEVAEDFSISSKDTSICNGDSILLTTSTVTNALGLTYTWTPTTRLSESTKTSTLAFPTATQNYKIVVSNGKGCTDSSNILLTVHDLPSGTISQSDTFLCPGEQSTLEISSTSNVSAQWYYSADGSIFQTSSSSLSFATAGIGYYFGVIENTQKCQSITDTLELKASLVVTNPVISLNGSNINDNELKWCISNALDLKGNKPLISNQEYGSWFVSSGDTMFSTSSTNPDLGSIVFTKSGAFELNWTINTDLPNCGNDTASVKIVVYDESNAQLTLSTYDTCQFLDTLKITSSALNLTESGTWESNPLPKPLNAEVNSWYVLGKDLTIGENTFTWKVSNNVCPLSSTSSKVQIEANKVPKITLNPDLTLCQGSSIEEIAIVENGGSNPTFEWLFTGDTIGKTINASNKHALSAIMNEGTLSVKLTSNERCAIPTTAQGSMKVNVVLAPNPFLEINGDTTICENNPIDINAFDINPQPDTKYTWLRNSTALSETSMQIRSVNISGIYSLKADNGICPKVEVPLKLNLDVKKMPIVNANLSGQNQLETISGELLFLNGTHTGESAFWRTEASENPIYNPQNLQSGINTNTTNRNFVVELVASNGPCTASDFVRVLIHQPIQAPNVFTVNRDGINETFKIIGLDTYANARVTIFNRWGGVIYDTRDYAIHEWDGGESPEAVYYYVIELDEKDSSKNHTGVVHLIR